MRSVFCFFGWHKWSFASTEIPIEHKRLALLKGTLEIGKEERFKYKCEHCGKEKIRIKGITCFGDYERWEKKAKNISL